MYIKFNFKIPKQTKQNKPKHAKNVIAVINIKISHFKVKDVTTQRKGKKKKEKN